MQAGGQTVSADNVEQYLLHDQYDGLSDNATGDGSRQDALGSLTGAVLRQLQGQNLDIKALASAVSSAVAGRHLMVWSRTRPPRPAGWPAASAAASPRNRWMSRSSTWAATSSTSTCRCTWHLPPRPAGADTTVTLTTRMDNTTPPGQSQFIAGPFPGEPVVYGGYRGLVSANLPARLAASR